MLVSSQSNETKLNLYFVHLVYIFQMRCLMETLKGMSGLHSLFVFPLSFLSSSKDGANNNDDGDT